MPSRSTSPPHGMAPAAASSTPEMMYRTELDNRKARRPCRSANCPAKAEPKRADRQNPETQKPHSASFAGNLMGPPGQSLGISLGMPSAPSTLQPAYSCWHCYTQNKGRSTARQTLRAREGQSNHPLLSPLLCEWARRGETAHVGQAAMRSWFHQWPHGLRDQAPPRVVDLQMSPSDCCDPAGPECYASA